MKLIRSSPKTFIMACNIQGFHPELHHRVLGITATWKSILKFRVSLDCSCIRYQLTITVAISLNFTGVTGDSDE
jgi:hypothetical protein